MGNSGFRWTPDGQSIGNYSGGSSYLPLFRTQEEEEEYRRTVNSWQRDCTWCGEPTKNWEKISDIAKGELSSLGRWKRNLEYYEEIAEADRAKAMKNDDGQIARAFQYIDERIEYWNKLREKAEAKVAGDLFKGRYLPFCDKRRCQQCKIKG